MRSKRIKRSATVEGNLVTVDDPAFITLVKKPANQRAFGILRSAQEDDKVSKPASKRVSRTRRSEGADNLVRISLPGSLDEAGVTETLASYGLSNFTVTRSEDDTSWVAQNPGAINCTDVTTVNLADGIVAQIKRTEETEPTEGKTKLTVVTLEFDAGSFPDAASCAEWCQRNSVDFDEKALNNPSGNLVLQRAEVPEGEEVRLMELEKGVQATIIRSQVGDIPDGFIAVINEYAYGGWGWGQLDFNASMADEQVTDALNDGLWMLSDLFRNILFYSELPVDVKKDLVTRACGQFAEYANGLLDSLPRQLLVSVASIQRKEKEHEMTTAAKKDEKPLDVQRSEPVATPAPGTPEFITAVAETVATVLAQRDEAAKQVEADRIKREEDEAADKLKSEEAANIRRAEITEAVTAATLPLVEKITALEGTTVLRGEGGDQLPVKKEVKRGTGDLFKGCFGAITRTERAADPEDGAAPGADQ